MTADQWWLLLDVAVLMLTGALGVVRRSPAWSWAFTVLLALSCAFWLGWNLGRLSSAG